MEGQRTNHNSSNGNISSLVGNLSGSNTSFMAVLEDNSDTVSGIDLNVPYAPPVSRSNSPGGFDERSSSTVTQCTNCGQKRKAPDGSSEDNNEDSQGNTRDCQCQVTPAHDGSSQSTNPNDPSISQGPSTLEGDTSGSGNGNSILLSRIAHNYRNVRSRRTRIPQNVRRSSSPSNNPPSDTPLTYWNARTSVNGEGEVAHNMQAPTRISISSQLGIYWEDGSPNNSNQVATGNQQYISLLEYVTSSIVAVESDGGPPDPAGMNMDNVIEGTTAAADRAIFIQSIRRREVIAQVLGASNLPVQTVANAPLAAASSRREEHPRLLLHQAFPNYTSEANRLAAVTNMQFHDDRVHNLRLNLDGMSDEQITNLIRVNTRLNEEDILHGLITRRYRSSRTNDEEEQDMCCICLDELEDGQELIKLDCGHRYHFECIKRWLAEKNCCAVCKKFAIQKIGRN